MKTSAEAKARVFLMFCGLTVFLQKEELYAPWVPVKHSKCFA